MNCEEYVVKELDKAIKELKKTKELLEAEIICYNNVKNDLLTILNYIETDKAYDGSNKVELNVWENHYKEDYNKIINIIKKYKESEI